MADFVAVYWSLLRVINIQSHKLFNITSLLLKTVPSKLEIHYDHIVNMSSLPPVYIVSAVRTPVGSFLGYVESSIFCKSEVSTN